MFILLNVFLQRSKQKLHTNYGCKLNTFFNTEQSLASWGKAYWNQLKISLNVIMDVRRGKEGTCPWILQKN